MQLITTHFILEEFVFVAIFSSVVNITGKFNDRKFGFEKHCSP